jgi:hypothetical protein
VIGVMLRMNNDDGTPDGLKWLGTVWSCMGGV